MSVRFGQVPHVIYRLYDEAGALLYIGMTSDFEARMALHMSTSTMRDSRIGGCAELQARYHHHTLEPMVDWRTAREAERAAIEAEAPELNRQHNPKRWRFDGRAKKWVPAVAA